MDFEEAAEMLEQLAVSSGPGSLEEGTSSRGRGDLVLFLHTNIECPSQPSLQGPRLGEGGPLLTAKFWGLSGAEQMPGTS